MTNILFDVLNAFLKKDTLLYYDMFLIGYEAYIFIYNEDCLNVNSKVKKQLNKIKQNRSVKNSLIPFYIYIPNVK